ncbi:hypothetical protein KSZ88_19585 [Bacteroides thetaiotaomicron]|uniref:hypothetical protein n=1 Tax=Bacteroides thetaiotaomicron TaxID=818 RepID=UPI001C23C665|nr:hypothetical protein [Bacteroides thetaiotaomicron]MBU9008978.1 hypothetical protein [Bacteroides thetaiotaomicron]MBU9075263.1 hypothetical protein [Bacteroides thetaiotaomicron]MBV4263731.1 hypothetical protein [Bacteroides thetaiotaomicron]MCB7309765.1 hypothetical protein [Bacteroides thetaiotaomicron]MCG4873181.1 hypothetical protein [Bacteroides thetaiotaomicron]
MNRIGGRDVGVSARPYIDPELLSHVKMAISTWGKTNDDPDRAVLKDLSGNGNDMRLLNFGFAGNSGYGLYSTDFTKWTKRQINDLEVSPNKISVSNKDSETALVIWLDVNKNRYVIPSYKIKVSKLTKTITYYYIDEANPSIRSTFSINKEGTYILPISRNDLYNGEENTNIGFGIFPHESFTIEQLPDFEGWLCTDGVDDIIESVKPISEMLEGSNEITVVSIIHQISLRGISDIPLTNYIRESNIGYVRNELRVSLNKTGIYGYTCFNIQSPISSNSSVINNILGDKEDYRLGTYGKISNAKLSVQGFIDSSGAIIDTSQVAYAGGFIANKVLTTDEINQIIAYFNLDRPGQIIKPQLYCNIKKQGITNDNHAEFNDQLIDFVGGHNIQLNNIGWKGESGIIDGALYLDGISDFGKATGLPVLKDYTICALRKWLYDDSVTSTETGSVVSKSLDSGAGAFILENKIQNYRRSSCYSFGQSNSDINNDRLIKESFTYQSKYSYNGNPIQPGTGVDNKSMWLGTIRDGDNRFSKLALWSLMLFPYSLSEFLLERQLRKYKAGTLYPDMIEFRPIVKSNIPYLRILYFITSTGDQIIKGSYIPIGSVIQINIQTVNATDEISSVSVNGKEVDMYNKDETYWRYRFKVTKSPQKINIVISSYLTMLNNDTLIENETLIKNE